MKNKCYFIDILTVIQTTQLPKDIEVYWQEQARFCLLMLSQKPTALAVVMIEDRKGEDYI